MFQNIENLQVTFFNNSPGKPATFKRSTQSFTKFKITQTLRGYSNSNENYSRTSVSQTPPIQNNSVPDKVVHRKNVSVLDRPPFPADIVFLMGKHDSVFKQITSQTAFQKKLSSRIKVPLYLRIDKKHKTAYQRNQCKISLIMPFQTSVRILDFVMMVTKKTFCPH